MHLILTLLPAPDARTAAFNAAVTVYCARCYQACSHASWTGSKVTKTRTDLCTWCANAFKAGTGQTVANLTCGFWQASYMASCGSLHLVDHASQGPRHRGGPLPRPGPTSARSLPPASQESSQTHTWQSMVSSNAAWICAWPAGSACRLAVVL